MIVKSPITGLGRVKKVDEVDVDKILEAYENIGIKGCVEKYFSGIEKVPIFECLDTKYRFYYPNTIFGDDEFYAYLQRKRKYYADWRWEHEVAYNAISAKSKVLEIGCGTGNFINRLKKEKRCDCFGLDFNKSALRSAKERGLDVMSQTIDDHVERNEERYDYVCLFQVLEHISNTGAFLGQAIKCLKQGGVLIIGVPNNNPYLFRFDRLHALNLPPHHAGLWNKNSLKKIEDFFDIEMRKVQVEPLKETEYFWRVQEEYWQKNKKLTYHLFFNLLSEGVRGRLKSVLNNSIDGRNILAMYSKNERK